MFDCHTQLFRVVWENGTWTWKHRENLKNNILLEEWEKRKLIQDEKRKLAEEAQASTREKKRNTVWLNLKGPISWFVKAFILEKTLLGLLCINIRKWSKDRWTSQPVNSSRFAAYGAKIEQMNMYFFNASLLVTDSIASAALSKAKPWTSSAKTSKDSFK